MELPSSPQVRFPGLICKLAPPLREAGHLVTLPKGVSDIQLQSLRRSKQQQDSMQRTQFLRATREAKQQEEEQLENFLRHNHAVLHRTKAAAVPAASALPAAMSERRMKALAEQARASHSRQVRSPPPRVRKQTPGGTTTVPVAKLSFNPDEPPEEFKFSENKRSTSPTPEEIAQKREQRIQMLEQKISGLTPPRFKHPFERKNPSVNGEIESWLRKRQHHVRRRLDRTHIEYLKAAFQVLDAKNCGAVSGEDLNCMLDVLHMPTKNQAEMEEALRVANKGVDTLFLNLAAFLMFWESEGVQTWTEDSLEILRNFPVYSRAQAVHSDVSDSAVRFL